MKKIIPVKGEAKPSKDLISQFPKFKKVKTIMIDRVKLIKHTVNTYIHYGITISGRREYYSHVWFSKVRWIK